MSFRDLDGGASITQFRRRAPSTESGPPKQMIKMENRSGGQKGPKPRRNLVVLHGRVQPIESTQDVEESPSSESINSSQGFSSAQALMQRKSIFSKLTHETQVFGRMVSDLEKILGDSGQSPEAAWRARILMRSAQETDKGLWSKLFQYEKTLHGNQGDVELRQAQTACMKLHRDFKRIHKSLVLSLSLYQKRQKAEVSQLGAIGWTTPDTGAAHDLSLQFQADQPQGGDHDQQEDFFDRAMREREDFDRAMRERELLDINKKMNSVNEIYKELAQIVDEQQEKIDDLEEDADYSKYNVKAARERSVLDDLLCSTTDEAFLKPGRGIDEIDWHGLFFCGNISQAVEAVKESYGLMKEEDVYREKERSSRSSTSDSEDTPVASDPVVESTARGDNPKDFGFTGKRQVVQREETNTRTRQFSRESPSKKLSTKIDDYKPNLRISEQFHWMMPFETITQDVKDIQKDLMEWGKDMLTPTEAASAI